MRLTHRRLAGNCSGASYPTTTVTSGPASEADVRAFYQISICQQLCGCGQTQNLKITSSRQYSAPGSLDFPLATNRCRRHSQPQSRPRQTCRPPSKPSRALPAVPSWVSIRITVLNGPEPPARLRSIPNGLTIELDGAASPYSRRTPYPTCGRPSPPRHISRAADKDGTSHRPVLRKGLS